MPSLLSAAQISGAESLRDDIFSTFAREFVCYKTPQLTIIDSNLNYKYSYGIQPEGVDGIDYTAYNIQSGTFSGVVQYGDNLRRFFSNPQGVKNEDFRVVIDLGLARLKIRKADFDNYIKDTQSIILDGKNFSIAKTERPHGLFSPKYYTLYLQFQN